MSYTFVLDYDLLSAVRNIENITTKKESTMNCRGSKSVMIEVLEDTKYVCRVLFPFI